MGMVEEKSDTEILQELIEYPSEKNLFSWEKVIKKYPFQAVLTVLGGGLLVLGGLFLVRDFQKNSQVTIIPIEETEKDASNQIMVHIAGAVEKPGLYQLPADARINDVLIAAGGLVEEANREWFSKNVNLAQKVSDGVKLYIPYENETSSEATQNQTVLGQTSGAVNINTATQAELESLPKIGPVTAQKIIDYRQEHGTFQSIEDLTKISGISQRTVESIKDKITLF